MSRFSIRNPHFIIVVCLVLMVIGVTSLARMPVDLFPTINLPEVVVATFYSGMPPGDIETDITDPLERFFTLASGIDHMESRSLLGVSIIKVFFQPGTNADADVTELSNLALADLKRLPPGTLPPVVLKFDASSLPVCLVTLKGEGLNQTQLHDIGQFTIRNQIAVVQDAEMMLETTILKSAGSTAWRIRSSTLATGFAARSPPLTPICARSSPAVPWWTPS
jgi:multidrug efflux pump subunit AcrB